MPVEDSGLYVPLNKGLNVYIGPFTDSGYTDKYYNPSSVAFVDSTVAVSDFGRLFFSEEGEPITPTSVADIAQKLGDGSLAALRAELIARDLPMPDELKTTEMLAADIRLERNSRLTEYDSARDKALREIRVLEASSGDTTALKTTLASYDAYARELCNLPQAEGFPWAGVSNAPWPTKPEGIAQFFFSRK